MTLRFASAADQGPLARLAELDSSTPRPQPVLLAEIDGQLRAALAPTDGTVVADPFHPTADLIELLRARGRQLNATPPAQTFPPPALTVPVHDNPTYTSTSDRARRTSHKYGARSISLLAMKPAVHHNTTTQEVSS